MTLANFKKNSKLITILACLMIYGAISFFIGKDYSKLAFFLKGNPKEDDQIPQNSIERPQPYSDTQSGSVISSYVKLCSNTQFRFEVSYPRDWFTTYDSEDQKCTYFAPFSFVINAKTANSLIPIRIEIVKIEDWLDTVKFYENPNDFQNIQASQNLLISDKSIKKIKAISTGGGATPQGFIKISYLVFDTESPLVVYYEQHDAKENVGEYEKIIEEMVASLKFF